MYNNNLSNIKISIGWFLPKNNTDGVACIRPVILADFYE